LGERNAEGDARGTGREKDTTARGEIEEEKGEETFLA